MATRSPFMLGEWYHCYNRGFEKNTVFRSSVEYERFLIYLFVSNSTERLRVSDIPNTELHTIFSSVNTNNSDPIVEVGAYSLMPNHVHFLLKEIHKGGIASYMQRVFTGYTMYFNNKHQRTGSLFSGTFKSKHVHDDTYLKQALPYVLLNPVELFESNWKSGVGSIKSISEKLLEYPYSSLVDFMGSDRPQSKIVHTNWEQYYDQIPTLDDMLASAQEYYQEHSPQV